MDIFLPFVKPYLYIRCGWGGGSWINAMRFFRLTLITNDIFLILLRKYYCYRQPEERARNLELNK